MSLVFTAVVFGSAPAPSATEGEPAEADDTEVRLERLEQDNAVLRQRLQQLEHAAEEPQEPQEPPVTKEEVEDLAAENAELEAQLERLRSRQEEAEARTARLEGIAARLGGYADVGFFMVSGDGSGIRPDLRNKRFSEHAHTPGVWVFMGDPLSTMVNARGDVADSGDSVLIDFDPIQSGSNPTLIVNALNLAPSIGLGDSVSIEALVDFLPRGRTTTETGSVLVGDYVDIKRAYIGWHVPVRAVRWNVYAGKIDGVFGREYRDQESPDRLTVTPSLMCRYTCGRPVGVSSRLELLSNRALGLNLSLTNGNTHYEAYRTTSEQETNVLKTATGRLSYEFPVGAGLEIGASGMIGAQDLQPRDDVLGWQYGVDVHLSVRGFELTAEFIQGQLTGRSGSPETPCSEAQCLDVLSAYGLVGYRVTNWLMPVFRTDWRDALHRMAGAFVYDSALVRFTPALRFEVGQHVILKSEYTFSLELGRIPSFPNNVFTNSVVARF